MSTILTAAGMIFSAVLGALAHFFYDWSGGNRFIGYFAAVNESTWEHLKLLFFPVLLFSVAECFIHRKELKTFIPARTAAILIGMLIIVVLFYTVSGITGSTDMPVINILIFLLGVASVFLITNIILKNSGEPPYYCMLASIAAILLIIAAFIVWTYSPPRLGLFRDPTLSR